MHSLRDMLCCYSLLVASLVLTSCGAGGAGGGGGGGGAIAPSITTQPANQTVTVGQTATFTVVASGTAPLTYQWQKNGAAISGVISASYTTPATVASDNNSQFVVVVSNTTGSISSSAATLTVNVPPPTISSVVVSPKPVSISISGTQQFSAVVSGTGNFSTAVTWHVNGVTGGNSTVGTIDSAGLYSAPAMVPNPNIVTVQAISVQDTTKSDSASVTIQNPKPQISGISPTIVVPGSHGGTLTVSGTNFVSSSTIYMNGVVRATTFVNSTQLTTTLTASDGAASGTLAISVVSPAPGGGASNTVNVIVNSSVAVNLAAPTIISDPNPANLFGGVVAALGNVIGTTGQDSVGVTALDVAYIVFDPAHNPGIFTVSQIGSAQQPGTKFIHTGISYPGRNTFVISSCGDKDGDGINDICIYLNGATSDEVNKPLAGTTFVIRGGSWLLTHPTVDLNDSTPAVAANISRIEGAAANNFAGQTITNGGNWDGSGYAITFIGAPGFGPLTNGFPAGAIYGVPGGPNFFGTQLYNLANINSFGGILTRNNSTGDNGYYLGSAFPGSGTIRLVGDHNGDGLPDLLIGDPGAQNKTPNTQRAYLAFGNRNFHGTFFVEDTGKTFGGATLFTDFSSTGGCTIGNTSGFCYNDFGTTVAGRDGSLMIATPDGGVGTSRAGTVFVSTQPITNGQVVDIRVAAQNLQATSLLDMSQNQDKMGMTFVDGADFRLIGMPGFDSNRGKLLFVPTPQPPATLPGGNIDVAPVTTFTLTGETQGDALTYGGGLDRSQGGSIFVGARSFTNDPQGGKLYCISPGSILF